jgi:hypothetical protein
VSFSRECKINASFAISIYPANHPATCALLILILLGSVSEKSIASDAGKAAAITAQQNTDCNASDRWSSISHDKLPKAPPDLGAVLNEGVRYPTGEPGRRLKKWLNEMALFEAVVQNGCKCNRYADPVDKCGRLNFDLMSNSNLLLWNVEKAYRVRTKQLLASGMYSQVIAETNKIFDIARTGHGGTRVLVSYLMYRLAIVNGMSTLRECLYWRNCPESVLKELLSLLVGLDDRSTAGTTVTRECEFIVKELIADSKKPDFFEPDVSDFHLTGVNPENTHLIKRIFRENSKSFDLNATISIMRLIATEASTNAVHPANQRQSPALDKLRQELAPLLDALDSKNKKNALLALPVSWQLSKVPNVVGKILVLDAFEGALGQPADIQDKLVIEIEATKILIGLNLFERNKHRLPASLDELVQNKFTKPLLVDNWRGYTLSYSAPTRTLAFTPVFGKNYSKSTKRQLTWKIPMPDME